MRCKGSNYLYICNIFLQFLLSFLSPAKGLLYFFTSFLHNPMKNGYLCCLYNYYVMNFSTLDIETVFVVLSGKISAAINRKMYRSFRKENIDITPEQWTVLHYLWKKDGVNQQELCNATFKDKPSMTRLIDNLEKQQLVTRTTSQDDRRINIINLTEKGRKLEKKTHPVVTRTKEVALQGVTDEEIVLAQQMLNKVFNNIKKSLDE